MEILTKLKSRAKAHLLRRWGYDAYPHAESTHLGFCGNFKWDQINRLCSEFTDKAQMLAYSQNRIKTLKQNPPGLLNYSSARLLSCIQHVMLQKGGKKLRILDFGGGFGNHFFQLRNKLSVEQLDWNVCETEHMVKAAALNFANEELKFISYSQLPGEEKYDILICSCSIHYLETPLETLAALIQKTRFVLLDRLPLLSENKDRLCIQHVEAQFYSGQHPWWFLSQSKLELFKQKHNLESIYQWPVPEDRVLLDGKEIEFSGCFLMRKTL